MTPRRIAIVEAQPLFRCGLSILLERTFPHCDIAEFETPLPLLDRLELGEVPDLLVISPFGSGGEGLPMLAHLAGTWPQLPIVVLTNCDEAEVHRRVLAYGARCVLGKMEQPEVMARHIAEAVADEAHGVGHRVPECIPSEELQAASRIGSLSPRQYRIASALAKGWLNKQIAHAMGIAETTVKVHVSEILRRLKLRNRTQVALLMRSLAAEVRPQEDTAPD